MSDLALFEFVLARIADDSRAVNDRTRWLSPGGWAYLEQFGDFGDDERWMIEVSASRVLADCEAKQAIVKLAMDSADQTRYGPGYSAAMAMAVAQLATLWADHPDYREEWRP